ncbi:MAG: calcium-binding protein, partial [Cypionkella sp.]|nr:calcium-binding protein [Cypionkella sp.]
MLFIDADDDGKISDKREYVFTEWSPGAADDMEAIRRAFDTNGDGKLTSADERFDEFKVMVTNADGSTTVKTLASDADDITITEINLTPDATKILLPDGSAITGQSTFVMNGVTHIAGNVTLATDAQGYRVVEAVSTSGGVRTVVQTGYAANGDKAFVITSMTATNGSEVTNLYDVNGDGVVDQLQTITTVTTSTGKTETVTNYRGATAETGVLLSKTVTERSSDGKSVTIKTDHTGGGWYDQIETFVTFANGTREHITKNLAQNGTALQTVTETLSASGLSRTSSIDIDGDGDNDTITVESISNTTGVRTETIQIYNDTSIGNDMLRETQTTTITTNALTHDITKIVGRNLDGVGGDDIVQSETTHQSSNGDTTSVMTTTSQNDTVLSKVETTVSGNGLVTTTHLSIDADDVYERTIIDTTVIAADGTRTNTVKHIAAGDGNAPPPIFEMIKTVLGADKVTSKTWVDLNQDGVFLANEVVKSVVVDAETQDRTTTTSDRNPDGSLKSQIIDKTSANGLSTDRTVDLDGDGDLDRTIKDVTVVAGDQSTTQTITQFAGTSATIVSKSIISTSSDGLMTITTTDLGGTDAIESKVTDLWVAEEDGSTLHIVSSYAGNGVTLLGKTIVDTNANRLGQTTEIDSNGDGHLDQRITSTTATDGSKVVLQQSFFANGNPETPTNGSLASAREISTTANGLGITSREDADGDGIWETIVSDVTSISNSTADAGTVTQTIKVTNTDSSTRSQSISSVN